MKFVWSRHIRLPNPNVAVLEVEGRGKAVQTGRPYVQQHITLLTFRDGRISHWKDYWNPMNVLTATAEPDQKRLQDAKDAIMDRIEDSFDTGSVSDSRLLLAALNTITDLRRESKIDDLRQRLPAQTFGHAA
jgi:hypothetical protein